ncbi:MAG: T9SS type A sorting domain-containing protein [Candidatus Cloacimonetes bacterium]|nr:T9SS type A sorting domain-containing protein [Candidatus Cloacimonadota bacterium]
MARIIMISLVVMILSCFLVADDVKTFTNPNSAIVTINPNPFETVTTISVTLQQQAFYQVDITDAQGHVLNNLFNGTPPAGTNNYSWDGTTDDGTMLPPGKYVVDVHGTLNFTSVKRIIILK